MFLHGGAIKWRAEQGYGIRRVPKHLYPCPERKQEFLTSEEHTTSTHYREIYCAKKDGVWLPSSLTATHHCLAHVLSVQQVEAPFLVSFPQQSTLQGEEGRSQLSFKAGVTLQKPDLCVPYPLWWLLLRLQSRNLWLNLQIKCARTVLWPVALLRRSMSLLLSSCSLSQP